MMKKNQLKFTINPQPEDIIRLRQEAQKLMDCGIEQAQIWCAESGYRKRRMWKYYESGEKPIDLAVYELVFLKVKYHLDVAEIAKPR